MRTNSQEIILDELEARNIDISTLSIAAQEYLSVAMGQMTSELAKEFSQITDISVQFFLNLHDDYETYILSSKPPTLD